MAVTTIVPGVNGNVYRNAIQPVGEAIYLNFVNEAVALVAATPQSWFYDFDLDDNYAVTGLEAAKTITPIVRVSDVDSQSLLVYAWRLGAGTDAAATVTNIGQLCFTGLNTATTVGALSGIQTGQLGSRVHAGRINAGYDPGGAGTSIIGSLTAIGGTAAGAAAPTFVTNLFAAGNQADPMVRILATAPTAVGTVTKQRLRIAIVTVATLVAVPGTLYSASCFIKLDLARFNDNAPSDIITHSPTGTGTVSSIV
jgi:hypothetical protein